MLTKSDNQMWHPRNLLKIFRTPVAASKSYRYLARQVALELMKNEGGKLIVFSSATEMDTSNEILLMFSHYLQNELGSRLLIIDATFRNKGLSKLFVPDERIGLMNVLSGDGQVSFVSVTHPIKENISFIAVGGLLNNKMPYIHEAKINELTEELKQNYDFVIMQQDEITRDTRYLPFAKSADMVLLHLEERKTRVADFDKIKSVFSEHQIENVKYILSEP